MREHNERAWLAYTIANLQRAKKLPPFKKLLIRERDRPRQSPQQMLEIAKQWAVLLGGKVIGK